ncbi:MAG TPA: hypothetical protein VES42_27120, partial [Pilimelia sp.]|nr:hypothetical protein [Pilimelia sp.]
CRSLIGRDSMRVRSMPRMVSSVSRPSSAPGRFWVVAASVVRSRPVAAGHAGPRWRSGARPAGGRAGRAGRAGRGVGGRLPATRLTCARLT